MCIGPDLPILMYFDALNPNPGSVLPLHIQYPSKMQKNTKNRKKSRKTTSTAVKKFCGPGSNVSFMYFHPLILNLRFILPGDFLKFAKIAKNYQKSQKISKNYIDGAEKTFVDPDRT